MIDLQGYGPRLLQGAWVTIELGLLSLLLSIILGLLTATAKMSRSWIAHRLGTLYTTLIRGVPDLVLMMLLFFGGQIEAARAYGMSESLMFRRIRFPQMMRHALPGLSNNWMVLLKTTALVSVIGLTDMVRVAEEATKATHEPFTFLIPVAVIYLLIASVSEWGFARLQKRYNVGFGES